MCRSMANQYASQKLECDINRQAHMHNLKSEYLDNACDILTEAGNIRSMVCAYQ